jgi:hypothetical protein
MKRLPIHSCCIATAIFWSATITADGQPISTGISNNPTITTNLSGDKATDVLPKIEMSDVPFTTAIDALARAANVNYLIDPRVTKWWYHEIDAEPSTPWWQFWDSHESDSWEPIVTFRWKDMTAKQALVQMLNEHRLVLLEDQVTTIARITYTNQVVPPVDADTLGGNTNDIMSNPPNIEFQDVPITRAINNLARASGINYALDPQINFGLSDKNGMVKPEPTLTLHWANVTTKQALIAICQNYRLLFGIIPSNSIVLIRARNHPLTNFADASLLDSFTNATISGEFPRLPIIEFQYVPLTTALDNLARAADISYSSDLNIYYYGSPNRTGQLKTEPLVSVRWSDVTAKEGFIALCENYDLTLVKDSAGAIHIKPKD